MRKTLDISESLLEKLNQRGLQRQAVLLSSKARIQYTYALTDSKWEHEIKPELGEEIYGDLIKIRNNHLADDRLLDVIFGSKMAIGSQFEHRDYKREPLEIIVDKQFNLDTLNEAMDITSKLCELDKKGTILIYNEVKSAVENNEDLLFEIYKDKNPYDEDISEQEKEKLFRGYKNKLNMRLDKYLRDRGDIFRGDIFRDFTEAIAIFGFFLLYDLFPHEHKIPINMEEIFGNIEEYKKLYNNERERTLEIANILIKDEDECRKYFSKYLEREVKNRRFNVLFLGRKDLVFLLDEEIHQHGNPFVDLDQSTEELYKSDLKEREDFFNLDYMGAIDLLLRSMIGMEQIASGGAVTNPNASKVSVMQNHNHFPNIEYINETRQKLEEITREMRVLHNELPDISDLTVPTKLRKKKEHSYVVEEMPKNPLDVTFGNDSRCCIFVPEDIKEIDNGVFVAEYLTNDNIRLFGVYRVEGKRKKRTGMVLAFDGDCNKEKILLCNSLELSRFGISGGISAVTKVVDYAEGWLSDYAREYGYSGACMGSHDYNTSFNFSNGKRERVIECVRVPIKHIPFYSDVLAYDKEKKHMVSRKNSLYWLWRK